MGFLTRKHDESTSPASDPIETLDEIIEKHVIEHAEDRHQGCPVAAIAASDRLAWANQARVGIDCVGERLQSVCEKVEPAQKYWAVPRYRLKSDK